MLITLSRRTAICQSVAEVLLTGVAPLGAVSHRFNFLMPKLSLDYKIALFNHVDVTMATRFLEVLHFSCSSED